MGYVEATIGPEQKIAPPSEEVKPSDSEVPKAEKPRKQSFLSRINFFKLILNRLRSKKKLAENKTDKFVNPEAVAENDRKWAALESKKPLSPEEMWQVKRGEVPSSKRPAAQSKSTEELAAEIAKLTKADEQSEKKLAAEPLDEKKAA